MLHLSNQTFLKNKKKKQRLDVIFEIFNYPMSSIIEWLLTWPTWRYSMWSWICFQFHNTWVHQRVLIKLMLLNLSWFVIFVCYGVAAFLRLLLYYIPLVAFASLFLPLCLQPKVLHIRNNSISFHISLYKRFYI